MLTINSKITVNKNIVDQVMDGEVVLVLPDQQKIKVLNELGAFIWQLLQATTPIDAIIKEVLNSYEVSSAVAEKDTLDFLQALAERDIIQIGESHS